MKKHECNYCKKNQNRPCHECDGASGDSSRQFTYSTLYASEFLLYMFHFEHNENTESETISAHPLMMMVVEG